MDYDPRKRKKCCDCGKTKTQLHFYKWKTDRKQGFQVSARCRQCHNKLSYERKKANMGLHGDCKNGVYLNWHPELWQDQQLDCQAILKDLGLTREDVGRIRARVEGHGKH